MSSPPPRLTASYQALAGHPAHGYPAVSAVLMRELAGGFPPAVAVRVCTPAGNRCPYSAAGGWARLADAGFPDPVPADADTLFDLASLTKVTVTLPLVLLLHQRGRWSIDDPLARWLPGAPRSTVTISDCLLHVAGLVPHRPYYATCADPAEIRRAVTAELADAVPGPVSYSDLGFMLLGWAVEECVGEPLAELAAREVLGPLGMTSAGYRPRAPLRRFAATEADGDQRPGPGLAWGSVHDGNAFALGGVSGHAGLFGTAADLGRFVSALLTPDRHPVLSAETIALMTARRAGTDAEPRVLGWRLQPDAWGSWPDGTIWHTGFTGTSLLVAPALDVAVVLLSNAVHPVRRLDQVGAFRARVHQAIRDALDGLALTSDAAPHDRGAGRLEVRCGPPVRYWHQSRLNQFQAVKEPQHLGLGAEGHLLGDQLVHPVRDLGHRRSLDVAGWVRQRQVAPGRHGSNQPGHDPVRIVLIADVLQDRHQHDRHRTGEVQYLRRRSKDRLGVAQVGIDARGGTVRPAGQERLGVGQHHRVIVHVHHAALRRRALGYLVRVVRGGQARTDVQELADPGLADQVPHRPPQEYPVPARRADDVRVRRDHPLSGYPVDGEVILPAQPVVIDPGDVRHGGVHLGRLRPAVGQRAE
jgi:serine-type D-Ala-D-Ala carboxypeptidase